MRWNIDASHSTAEFSVRHLMITNVKGRFAKLEGWADYDPANPAAARLEVTIDATSLDTREDKRDAHLRSADFFDTDKYPKLTFTSKQIEKHGDGLRVHGELAMHGVTKPVTLEVEGPSAPTKDPWGNTRIGASAAAKINRKDWGLGWNQALEAGGVVVGETVKLQLDVSFVAAK